MVAFFIQSRKSFYFWGCFFLAWSKIFQTVAFFLPIKILIMLNENSMPDYLSGVELYLSYDSLLAALIIMVPIVYLMHILFGILFRNCIDQDIKLYGDEKFDISGHGEVGYGKLKRLHNHTSKAFSDILVFVLTSIILLYLNVSLAIIVWAITFCNLLVFVNKAFYLSDDDRLTFLKLHKRQFIEYIASSNYLIVFGFLVFQTYFSMGEMYGAILALLLSRQLFQAVQRFSIENIYFSKL